ncbi:MAG: rod shape-determining protein [Patescibacteria group bacterium]|jgi:rod shape-determining protein MreB|nr:rod shape-determining protein [Patescibacteria group bacterium]MDD5172600.1 rod shape-determining protein [Patescibacteria group bacterium]
MLKKFFGLFSKDIGIDLGTTNVRVYVRGRGLVINEASVVAVNLRNDQIVAIGNNALKMMGKSPNHILIIKPLNHGVISDFEVTEKMLKLIFEKVHRDTFTLVPRPRVVAAIPLDVTEVEKKSLEDVILQAGAREVFLVERPVAAAIGVRLPIQESIGNLIVELGGGLSEAAVISLNGIVSKKSLKMGGELLNKNIIGYVREKFGVLLGDQTAEEIKIKIGSAFNNKNQEIKVKGRDLVKGLPKEILVNEEQVREAIMPSLKTIIEGIHETIEATPPELVSDIYERGIILSGGGAQLRGLDKIIQKKINIPVIVTDDPSTAIIRGTGLILEDFENLKQVFIPSARD